MASLTRQFRRHLAVASRDRPPAAHSGSEFDNNSQAEGCEYPDASLTPGKADTVSVADLTDTYECPISIDKDTCTYSQSHRSVSTSKRKKIYDAYSVPQNKRNRKSGEIDHFDPLCNGGSNDAENLWFQPIKNMWNGKNFGYKGEGRPRSVDLPAGQGPKPGTRSGIPEEQFGLGRLLHGGQPQTCEVQGLKESRAMPNPNSPFYPIIYVRGYAMTEREQDETTADPFCGFNLGSTVYRATPDKNKPAKKFIFESPVLRLTTDYGYSDSYHNGLDILDLDWEGTIPPKSVVIYRYYDQASRLLGTGKTPDITEFAKGLSQLILRVRDLVCSHPNGGFTLNDFRCYLVAHSMGGLVCRAFLQNPDLGDEDARRCVDKVFTYATPHNGIEMAGLNVPKWLSDQELNTFNRDNMARYLNIETLYKQTGRVDWLPEGSFPSNRFFCMVGTNRADYEVAMGLSRTFAGHGSDGLVRIENASVWGVNDKGAVSAPCATAYAYRSHSGYFGIVNSEEAYQNLKRFVSGS